jgi:hypothetical protein
LVAPPGKTGHKGVMQRRALLVALKLLAQGAAVVFVAWTAWNVAQGWTGLPAGVPVVSVVISGIALFVSNFVLAAAWQGIVEGMIGRKLGWRSQLRMFMASNMGRYVPGKLALPAIRIAGLGALGIGPAVVGGGMFLELLSWVAASGVVAFGLLSFGPSEVLGLSVGLPAGFGGLLATGLLLGSLTLSAALLLVDRRRLPSALLRIGGVSGSGPLISVSVLLNHLVYWLCWWVHGVLLVQGFGASFTAAATASAAFILGPVLGFLALVAPAGAGVKEAVVIALVTPVTGVSSGVVIGVLSRVLSLIADVLAWLLSVILCRGWSAPAITPAPSPSPTDAGSQS